MRGRYRESTSKLREAGDFINISQHGAFSSRQAIPTETIAQRGHKVRSFPLRRSRPAPWGVFNNHTVGSENVCQGPAWSPDT